MKSDDDCGKIYLVGLFPGPRPKIPPEAIAVLERSIW